MALLLKAKSGQKVGRPASKEIDFSSTLSLSPFLVWATFLLATFLMEPLACPGLKLGPIFHLLRSQWHRPQQRLSQKGNFHFAIESSIGKTDGARNKGLYLRKNKGFTNNILLTKGQNKSEWVYELINFQKMTQKIWRISALRGFTVYRAEILQKIFGVIFWKIDDFINTLN